MPPLRPDETTRDRETAQLRAEVAALQARLDEATERLEVSEATVQAIQSGEVDAVVVQKQDDSRVFTLAAPEKFYLQLAQEVANVGTWEVEFATGLANLSEGMNQLLGIAESGPVPVNEIIAKVASEDRDRIQQTFERARTSSDDHYYEEFQIGGSEGESRWLAAKGAVIRGPNGERSRIVGVTLDISERKAAEKALKESERGFRELADSMPQIVWMARPDGSVEYFNRRWSEFTGAGGAEKSREQRLKVVHPDDRDRAQAAWDVAVRTGSPMEVEYRFRDASTGQYRWHLGRAVPIRNDRGQILRWFGTATDIHDQKSLQNTLREADHRKDQFLAMLAHELRNPLSPLMIAADLIASEMSVPPQIREMADVMRRQTAQLKRLIDDLLDVSRISTGRLELRRDRVDVKDAIDAALDVSRPLIESAGHALKVQLPTEPMLIEGDKVRLTQVVGNLVINAAKYTPAGGEIALAVALDGDHVVITVSDNGIGIGLTLVKTLVEMHGGHVKAESDGDGQGSRFTVTLPALNMQAAEAEARPRSDQNSARRRRVLIIDDNESASYLLGKLLTKLEQEVHVEQSAIRAIACVHEFQPDIVISDIAMPDVSGHQLAREIRNLPLSKQPILVALTGYGQEDDRQASLAAGFDMHVTKPIDIATLRAILQSA